MTRAQWQEILQYLTDHGFPVVKSNYRSGEILIRIDT